MKRRSLLQLGAIAPFLYAKLAENKTSENPKTPPEAQYVIDKYGIKNVFHFSKFEARTFIKCNDDGSPIIHNDFTKFKDAAGDNCRKVETGYSKLPRFERLAVPSLNIDDPLMFKRSRRHTLDIIMKGHIDDARTVIDNYSITKHLNLVIIGGGMAYGIASCPKKIRKQEDIIKEYG